MAQGEESQDDETSSSSSIGSLDKIDRVEEDLNRTPWTRATGYMGKNSEVTWMQSLQKETEHRSQKLAGPSEAKADDQFSIHCMSYHLDNMDISVPGPVQVYRMPPQSVADRLFDDFLDTVYPFFPIINRPLFRSQYQTFFRGSARPGDKWLAILNLIFAIAAKHAHLTQSPWRGESHDHLVYLTRARTLSMNGDILFSHPDLQQIQVEGLTAFYLLACDQLNRWVLSQSLPHCREKSLTTCRAWRIAALAVRSSLSLGLNLKNTSNATIVASKEARYKVWWCVYTLEHMLGIMTGRVTCISDGVFKTPFPLPFDEEQPSEPGVAELLGNHGLHLELIESKLACYHIRHVLLDPQGVKRPSYTQKKDEASWLKSRPPSSALGFLYYADLAVIAQEIVNQVYSLDCCTIPWDHIESRIRILRARVELWQSNLPDAYDFTNLRDQGQEMLRTKLLLGFHYYSSQITLGRPCLCRRDSQPTLSDQRSTFSHEMALVALESARLMLDLIPNSPDPIWLYRTCPWWCILHYLMQSVTVLLIELSFGCIHQPEEEKNILKYSRKAVLWLLAMSDYSLASRRAWELCDSSFRRIAQGMDYDVGYSLDSIQRQRGQQLSLRQKSPSRSRAHIAESPPPGSPTSDHGFPFDPISGELIRSFFPFIEEEDPWDEM